MLYAGNSSREIGEHLGVSHSTIQREVKRNRIEKIPNIRVANPAAFCKHYDLCAIKISTCKTCNSEYTYCKKCHVVRCYKYCEYFDPIKCPETEKWPYICKSNCANRKKCRRPKYSYAPIEAHKRYKENLVESRNKPYLDEEELKELSKTLSPYIENGFSPYAALASEAKKINIDVRTIYRYINDGHLDIPIMKLPRKVRYKQRKKVKAEVKSKIDRSGRMYSDFLALSEETRKKYWQMDSVEGKRVNNQRLLTIHQPKLEFQLLQLVKSSSSFEVVNILDYYEKLLGSRKKFNKIFPGFLVDRGREFDFWKELERSFLEPSKKRCRIFYCDTNRPDQKGSAEKNHEHIRCVLPKGYSDFDALTNFDIAKLCSNINNYPRKSLEGKSPISFARNLFPKSFLATLGIEEVPPKKIVLNTSLLPHTQH